MAEGAGCVQLAKENPKQDITAASKDLKGLRVQGQVSQQIKAEVLHLLMDLRCFLMADAGGEVGWEAKKGGDFAGGGWMAEYRGYSIHTEWGGGGEGGVSKQKERKKIDPSSN